MSLGELTPQQVSQARELARILREGSLGLLVGAGLSRAVGIPLWPDLLVRLSFIRYVAETGIGATRIDWDTFRDALAAAFPEEIQRAQALASRAGSEFDRELWQAMYLPAAAFAGYSADALRSHEHEIADYQPNELMRAVLALACRGNPRPDVTVHTLNFDDLLERAAANLYPGKVNAETASRNTHRDGLTIAHLHGRLGASRPAKAEDVVLAATDFHRARAAWEWPYRRLFDLFEQHTVLMVGIGLNDPNLLQVLDLVPPRRHYLLHAVDPSMMEGTVAYEAWRSKQQHWDGRVEFISLNAWSDQAALVHAVRTFASDDQDLWQEGHRRLLQITERERWDKLWEPQISGKAARLLRNLSELAREKLRMDPGSRIETGLFVPDGGQESIDLPFRSDVEKAKTGGYFRPGPRRLRASVIAPQGVAGMAFARAELLIAHRDAELFDNRFDPAMTASWQTSRDDCAVVACAPVFDWGGRGTPVGVGYLTSSSPSDLDLARLSTEDVRFLDEVLLGTAMLEVLRSLRRERSA